MVDALYSGMKGTNDMKDTFKNRYTVARILLKALGVQGLRKFNPEFDATLALAIKIVLSCEDKLIRAPSIGKHYEIVFSDK